jgi:hypothetical protein
MEAKLFYRDKDGNVSQIPVGYTVLPPVLFFVGQAVRQEDLNRIDMEVLEYVSLAALSPELAEMVHKFVRENLHRKVA